ncbi:hypothetical protein ACFYKX_11365 [Cytobacillus sp. FJAT-54145]|uniref:Uncharacterized protein n=1 Tax=Cytobacillus spartinae TaxID=3299023 RepID=A0ABW6KAK0_9BACI
MNLFSVCPPQIHDYLLQEMNTQVPFKDPEALVELVEYQVILPILAYQKGTRAYGLTFFEREFRVCLVDVVAEGKVEEKILETFKLTQVEEARDFLVSYLKDVVKEKAV